MDSTICNDCDYYLTEGGNSRQQECKKWVKNGTEFDTCDSESGNKNAECSMKVCPPQCQYPFPKDYYKDEILKDGLDGAWDGNGIFIKKEIFKSKFDNNSGIVGLGDLLSDTQNIDSKLERTYDKSDWVSGDNFIGKKFRCGENGTLLEPQSLDKNDRTVPDKMEFPLLPTKNQLRDAMNNQTLREYTGINWRKFKKTPLLIEQLKELEGVEIDLENDLYFKVNGNEIYYSPYGVDVDLWKETYSSSELKSNLPDSIRQSINLDDIKITTTDITKNTLNSELVHTKLFNDKMVPEQIRDWAIKRDIQVMTGFDGLDSEFKQKFSLSNLFGIENPTQDSEVEHCFNRLMHTNNNGKSDEEYLKHINTYNHLYDLGKPENSGDLFYVEKKIKKFLSLKKEEVIECFTKYYGSDLKICSIGISSNAIKIITSFLDMESELSDNKEINEYIEKITHRLSRYMPNIISKIIYLSESFEIDHCGEISNNTKLLKELYSRVFKDKFMINFPDFGIPQMLSDISQYWVGQILLLLIFTYLFSQIISLFRFNYTINSA